MTSSFDVSAIRKQFPALARMVADRPAIFFDGPAGSQVPQRVIDAVSHYLAHSNANTHGAFVTSAESDAMLSAAGEATADFIGASDPKCVAFGPNMTTLTFSLSRAFAQIWKPGDEVIVSRSDHDANVSPWVLAARDAGATVRWIDIQAEDTTLQLDQLRETLNERTQLVAVGAASNATGTAHPIRQICDSAHAVGARVFVDAVHYAPHNVIDVKAWDCDFLACSAYKFFGPHVGILWGKKEPMSSLPAYRLRPAGDALPDRWMTGTQNHEGLAGTIAAIDYLADIGRGQEPACSNRREALIAGFETIAAYERGLLEQFMCGLAELRNVKVWGITDPARFDERVPTISFTHAKRTPLQIARHLGERGIFVWDGNYYAIEVTESLGLEPDGMVRVGLLHYNTAEEVSRLLGELAALDE